MKIQWKLNFNRQSDKNDKQKSIRKPEGKLPKQKQVHALTIRGAQQGKGSSKTHILQPHKPDKTGRGIKQVLYKKREKKK